MYGNCGEIKNFSTTGEKNCLWRNNDRYEVCNLHVKVLHKKLPRIVKESQREHAKLKKGRDYQFLPGATAIMFMIAGSLEAAAASTGAATGLVAAADATRLVAGVAGAAEAAGGGGPFIGAAAAGAGLGEAGALAGVAAEGVLAGAGAGLVAGAAIEGGVPSDRLQR